MPSRTSNFLSRVRSLLPYLWGAAAAVALDRVIDIQALFLPVLAAIIVGEAVVLVRRVGR